MMYLIMAYAAAAAILGGFLVLSILQLRSR